MAHRFGKHYTLDEARELLPKIHEWLDHLVQLRDRLRILDEKLAKSLSSGVDLGGDNVNEWIKSVACFQETYAEFQKREIQVKDLDRGLIDFPAFVGGKEVFLCWEKHEQGIEYWHDLNSGYAGREHL